MDKVWTYIFDIIIAVVIIFASVTIYFGLRMETVIKSIVINVTDNLATDIKKNGYFTLEEYEIYLDQLSMTHSLYDVSFEHSYAIWEPEYRRKTLQEIIDAQNATYTGKNIYIYKEVTTELPTVNDPVNNETLNTDTNESVLAAAINTPSLVNHIHTDACYNGTKHIHSGNAISGGGCYGTNHGAVVCGMTHCTSVADITSDIRFTCSRCGGTCTGRETLRYYYWSCGHTPGAEILDYYWSCNRCESKSLPCNPMAVTRCNYLISSGGYSINCGKKEGLYYNGDTLVSPICGQVVISISATHPSQTVSVGDAIITTVVATYLDGSTKTLIGEMSGYDSSKLGTQSITLSYTGLIDNAKTTGRKTCIISVKVVARKNTCINGHTYNLHADGSDPGCPYCKAYVASLQLIYPESPNLTLTIGTTLKENGVILFVTYMDNRTEIITDGYVDNLDKYYLGTTIVTIGYQGATTQLNITTVCIKKKCTICGKIYDLYPDGTDPGCPHCIAKIPVFTGKVLEYNEEEYTETILSTLYHYGRYSFSINDTFTIKLYNKSSNIARGLLRKVYPSVSDSWLDVKVSENICSN